jgi:hypothetical protein
VATPGPDATDAGRPGRRPGALPFVVALVVVAAALWVAPSLFPEAAVSPVTAIDYEPAPFGEPLAGALAYLGENRTFNLVELEAGELVGSKGIPADRRPAAASADRAYLGSAAIFNPDGNWEKYRSLPWAATEYRNDAAGVSLAYSEELDIVAAAMRPLPDGSNGVVLSRWDGRFVAASSSGHWGFATWVGDRVLVRELAGGDCNWWLIDGLGDGNPEAVDLPDEFLPIVGTEGLVMGQLGERGLVVDLASGSMVSMDGSFSWAADWSGGIDPRVATVGGDPPRLWAYRVDGSVAWSATLEAPVTRFKGGLAWAPSGDFLVVVSGDTFLAYGRNGAFLGELSTAVPVPQTAEDSAFLTIVDWG